VIALTPDEERLITPVLEGASGLAGFAITLDLLLTPWEDVVRGVEIEYALTGYDYVNDLATRDTLQGVLAVAPSGLRERIELVVRPLDERFRASTRTLPRAIQVGAPPSPGWWWQRPPDDLTGEMARDLFSP
jgi:hypothetical protein